VLLQCLPLSNLPVGGCDDLLQNLSFRKEEIKITNTKPIVVACIPAYEEEETIARVILQAKKYVDVVLVCDDGSMDMTGEIAERMGAEVIRHEENMGYGAALASLFSRSREINPDVIVVLDADCQHDPAEIPKLVDPILRGEADIVSGSRFLSENGKSMPKYRVLGIKIITKLSNSLCYKGITDAQCGFRAYNAKALRSLKLTEQGMGVSTEILSKASEAGLRVKEVPVEIDYNVANSSKQNPLTHGTDVVLSIMKQLSMRHPLLFYGLPGIAALLIATIFWVWTFSIFSASRQIETNIALVAIGATLVGIMLLTTAVILWVMVSLIRERFRV